MKGFEYGSRYAPLWAAALFAGLAPALAVGVDWSQVEKHELQLFQPGQSAWEWLLVPSEHSGGKRMREGKDCLYCHAGEEEAIGNLIASGEKLEPSPMKGMPGTVKLSVQTAVQSGSLRMRLSWTSLAEGEPAGGKDVPAQVTVVLADDTIQAAKVAGCWAACHNDLPGMAEADSGAKLTKYLPNSRTRMTRSGGGTAIKSDADLAAELEKGAFYEYWQVELDQGTVHKARDGYFLDARRTNDESAVSAEATLVDGRWVVDITRRLKPVGGPRITLAEGKVYTVEFAVHDNHVGDRHHYVSFPMRMKVQQAGAQLMTESATGD